MPESISGGKGLYISFRNEDGSWSQAKDTGLDGSLASLSPDGEYLLYSAGGDIYWVDADYIDQFRQ